VGSELGVSSLIVCLLGGRHLMPTIRLDGPLAGPAVLRQNLMQFPTW